MADLIIRGVEMPENCCYCAFVSYDNDHCTAKDKDIPIYGTIPSWCPLVPLPEKHGRLIDADALNDVLIKLADNKYSPKVFASWLSYEENAPTIVPAEGGGEE